MLKNKIPVYNRMEDENSTKRIGTAYLDWEKNKITIIIGARQFGNKKVYKEYRKMSELLQ